MAELLTWVNFDLVYLPALDAVALEGAIPREAYRAVDEGG